MSLAYFAKVRKSVKKLNLEDLIRNLKNALSKAHKAADRDFLLKHLTFLQEKGLDNPATKKDLDFILKDIEKTLGQKLESLAEAPILQASMEAYTEGKKKVCKPFKIDYSLDDADLGALDTLSNFNGWYIRDKFSKDTSDIINRELGDLLERGGTKREFAQTLETALEDHVTESKQYWELLADHTLTKIQNMGHVSGYETAGVQYVKIVAVLDSKTTPICRAMNGKVFKVADFRKQYDKIIRAAEKHDLKAYKAAQPMISGKAMKGEISDEDIKRLGIKLPPYHFRCRTTHVAYFEGERELKQPERTSPKPSKTSREPEFMRNVNLNSSSARIKIDNVVNKFFAEHPEATGFKLKRYKGVSTVKSSEYTMATGDNVFLLNENSYKELRNYSPAKDLAHAFYCIKHNKALTVNGENAIQNFWHEVCHSKSISMPDYKIGEAKSEIYESFIEFYSRQTYAKSFLKEIGGETVYSKLIKEAGYSREVYALRFNKLLEKYDISQRSAMNGMEKLVFETELSNYDNAAAEFLASKSKKKYSKELVEDIKKDLIESVELEKTHKELNELDAIRREYIEKIN